MDQAPPDRLDLLEAGAEKSARLLVQLRQRIAELRFDGLQTVDAEAACRRFERTHQALLAKLDTLRREGAAVV